VWAKEGSTWTWWLHDLPGGRTRLLVRLKQRYEARPSTVLTAALLETADFPMMRRQLLGIRDRAEGGAPSSG
jgi:hypothetical protein